jgi:hypothetical protein
MKLHFVDILFKPTQYKQEYRGFSIPDGFIAFSVKADNLTAIFFFLFTI